MKMNTEPVRGTKDYLPKEANVREHVRLIILKTYKKYGFSQVITPVMEDINNLLGSDGGDNLKLIFKILKRGEKLNLKEPELKENSLVDLGLRYDLTVPLVRLFSNNQTKLPSPFKSIQIGESFRAERPQRGRLRQFIQCDIDIIGDSSSNAEIDILNTSGKTFLNLGFKNFTIKINDRRILTEIISQCQFEKQQEADICVTLDKFDKIGIEGLNKELLEKGYQAEKVNNLLNIFNDLTQNGLASLEKYQINPDVINSLKSIIETVSSLSQGKYKIIFDASIIRGQSYYTSTVYELYVENFAGASGGGGRYDNMIEKISGKSVPAVGFSIGFEPICMLLLESNMITLKEPTTAVLYRENDNFLQVLELIEKLNENGNASAVPVRKNLNFQLQGLKENGFTHYMLFDKQELKELD